MACATKVAAITIKRSGRGLNASLVKSSLAKLFLVCLNTVSTSTWDSIGLAHFPFFSFNYASVNQALSPVPISFTFKHVKVCLSSIPAAKSLTSPIVPRQHHAVLTMVLTLFMA